MSHTSSMKQIGSRNMGCVVEQMEWSNKMDLIAFGTDKGEVIIQRLNWQKIVTFPPSAENVQVRSLSWQLDATVLAVAYSNGKVRLLDAEREDQISSLDYDEDIKKVYFSKAINADDYKGNYVQRKECSSDIFLTNLPTLNGIGNSLKMSDNHKYFANGSHCFLVVIMPSGKVHLLLLGALQAGTIDLSQHVSHPEQFAVYDVRLSGDFCGIYALVRDGEHLRVLHFRNKVLQQYISPMLNLAVFCANILETKNYIHDTIQLMLESWETIVLEMDNKLTKYVNQQAEGMVAADFLELLVFGYATPEIEEFLTDELTEKGLKKVANSIDISYSTLQTLVTTPLQSAAVNMFYFLNTTKGLSRTSYFYKHLLDQSTVEQAQCSCGSFIMKVMEVQQVIDQCLHDMKLFFNWLGSVVLRLAQPGITEDTTQMSPEDTEYLAEYLNSFEDKVLENSDGTVTKRKFNLEKVAQYLENKDLQQISAHKEVDHLWRRLLEENVCLRESPLMYELEERTSLIQQRDKMLTAIGAVFRKSNESASASFALDANIIATTLPTNVHASYKHFVHSSYFANEATQCDLLVATISLQEVLLLEFDKQEALLRCTRVQLTPGPFTSELSQSYANLRFVDLQFYNEGTVSLLLHSNTTDRPQSHFVQFALETTRGRHTQHTLSSGVNLTEAAVAHSMHDLIDSTGYLKSIEGVCTHLAVSGSRKVVAILSEQRRKMTIFEMEIEDDEDETDMSQTSFLDISKDSVTSLQD